MSEEDERDQLIRLFIDGWEVRKESLYDEEGVEGWVWTSPSGHEYVVVGGWDEYPPLPEI